MTTLTENIKGWVTSESRLEKAMQFLLLVLGTYSFTAPDRSNNNIFVSPPRLAPSSRRQERAAGPAEQPDGRAAPSARGRPRPARPGPGTGEARGDAPCAARRGALSSPEPPRVGGRAGAWSGRGQAQGPHRLRCAAPPARPPRPSAERGGAAGRGGGDADRSAAAPRGEGSAREERALRPEARQVRKFLEPALRPPRSCRGPGRRAGARGPRGGGAGASEARRGAAPRCRGGGAGAARLVGGPWLPGPRTGAGSLGARGGGGGGAGRGGWGPPGAAAFRTPGRGGSPRHCVAPGRSRSRSRRELPRLRAAAGGRAAGAAAAAAGAARVGAAGPRGASEALPRGSAGERGGRPPALDPGGARSAGHQVRARRTQPRASTSGLDLGPGAAEWARARRRSG
ncbi:translation initiation factor IF-2-like [Vulpes lagopus]|uniref:translation initiation factor IF-2-like n=1 Tax=Vulpes lagopus TaxID=494514 RepID=UPI001BC9EF4F|nr:translation initiation factor IF-2-like [Vulpes lagopus]